MGQKILIIGGGGREHSLAWKLSQSSRVGKIFIAPGNGGTREIAENVPIHADNVGALASFAQDYNIDLTIVGPDNPLALGIVDFFQVRALPIFGPTQRSAIIEISKASAKQLMVEAGIPTADFKVFDEYYRARAYLSAVPIVIKASGLAVGKGVKVCQTLSEAEQFLTKVMINHAYQGAGSEVVIEEYLDGPELSGHALCDGKTFVLFPLAQDHKGICEGGDNTGGMGTIVPVPWVTSELVREIEKQVVRPILQVLRSHRRSFTGCLYPGIKMTPEGLKVLEFNARFGDPEAQSYMRLLESDLLDILEACTDGTLKKVKVKWRSGFAVCVVLASEGYPHSYKTGIPIYGVEEAEQIPGVVVFHAGTKFTDQLRTCRGRVLGVSAIGETLQEALDRAYEAVRLISFEGMYYRRDIGAKALSEI